MISKFLSLPKDERNILIYTTSEKMNMPAAIIEKDYWVCFILEYLFTSFKYKDFICFKGGTSLSKVYNCIERFSEDIDIALDWSVLGLLEEEVYANRSNRQQDFFNKEANLKTEKYIEAVWLPLIENDLNKLLKEKFNIYIDENDPQTICFEYPRVYQNSSVLPVLRLEIGALAEPVPSSIRTLKSYMAECYPNVFGEGNIHVKTVDIRRTFFEKVTILHREAHRTNGNYPLRYSRHFYDIYQMIHKGIANEALQDLRLMEMVVEFKKKFYPCKWAYYDEVLDGKCKLIPNDEALNIFAHDYTIMQHMLYGNYPTFDEITLTLAEFELLLNQALTEYVLVKI